MSNVVNLPKRVRSPLNKKTQFETDIYVVDFKSRTLVGKTVINNVKNEVVEQWGKSALTKKPRKKAA